MTPEKFAEEVWTRDFEISMNQAYHREMKSRFTSKDRNVKIGVLLLAVASCLLSILSLPSDSASWITNVSVAVSVVAVVLAAFLNHQNDTAMIAFHESMLANWGFAGQQLKRAVATNETVSAGGRGKTPSPVAVELLGQVNVWIERTEELEVHPPDKKLLQQCYEEENRRRWGVKTYQQVKQLKDDGVKPHWPGEEYRSVSPLISGPTVPQG